MNPISSRSAIGAAILLLCGSAAAQGEPRLKEVTVTGNPLGTELVVPATQYSGPGLLLRSQTTLGETLNDTPGVSSTYFGPNASRPVIRGLDGDRIRILSNSGAALDVSNLSGDHAVAADPISIERIEVLRKVNAFASRFRNYIALMSTGVARDAQGNGAGTGVTDCGDGTSVESGCSEALMPEFAFRQVRARFRGLEAGGNVRLLDGASVVDLELRGDLVRATNATTGEPLPRIAPARVGATLAWSQGPWGARVGFNHAARQNRVPVGELATGGYALWSAALTRRVKVGAASLLWYARLDNLADKLAYSATSILTQTAPGKAPLPGRSLKLGLQATF